MTNSKFYLGEIPDWLMRVHPAISGFSLAFVILLVFVEIKNILCVKRSTAKLLTGEQAFKEGWLIIGALGVALISSFLSGYLAEGFLYPSNNTGIVGEVTRHHLYGRYALILFPILISLRILAMNRSVTAGSRRFGVLYATLYFVVLSLVVVILLATGSLGGRLVFDYGVGVRYHGG